MDLMIALHEAADELEKQIARGRFSGVILHCNDYKVTVSRDLGLDEVGEQRGDNWHMIDCRDEAIKLIEAAKDNGALRAWAESEERQLQRWDANW